MGILAHNDELTITKFGPLNPLDRALERGVRPPFSPIDILPECDNMLGNTLLASIPEVALRHEFGMLVEDRVILFF
jgi:hypothetical protein